MFETATPFDTPRLVRELVDWTRAELSRKGLHPLIVIAVFVVVFLEIHPFQDGNGRLSRILTTLLLLRAGYTYVPYGSLESVIEAGKEAYYLALRRTQVTIRSSEPDWKPWLMFFLTALRQQQVRLDAKLERERILLDRLPELSVHLLDLCREHGRLTVAMAVELTGTNRNTAKDHLSRLTRAGHLARHGAGRGTWYSLTLIELPSRPCTEEPGRLLGTGRDATPLNRGARAPSWVIVRALAEREHPAEGGIA